MNKSFKKYLIYISVIGLLAAGCSNNSNVLTPFVEMNYRNVAYESLSEQSKATVINWQDGKVGKGIYQGKNGSNIILLDSGSQIGFVFNTSNVEVINGQRLIMVTFNTKDDPLLGPMILIIDPITNKVIGGVQRE